MARRTKAMGPRPIVPGDPVYDPQGRSDNAEFRAAWAERLKKGTVDTTGIYSSKLVGRDIVRPQRQAQDLPF